jgi:DNA-binding NtrC family response regulator
MAQLVMVIDDSLVIRKILEICLRRTGYAVKSFPDGVETLRWLNTVDAGFLISSLLTWVCPNWMAIRSSGCSKPDQTWSTRRW